jgi:hypothetical protein
LAWIEGKESRQFPAFQHRTYGLVECSRRMPTLMGRYTSMAEAATRYNPHPEGIAPAPIKAIAAKPTR